LRKRDDAIGIFAYQQLKERFRLKIRALILAVISLLFVTIAVQAQTPQTTQAVSGEQLYIQRLASLKSPVDLTYSPEVKRHIDAYLANPEKTREIISLSKIYFPLIERSLKNKNVPIELKYVAFALSELDPLLQHPSGASGMWMMQYNISKMYKVKVNSYIDERKDPLKSSNIAATHFKDLHSIYRQWPLVIAAYVSSPVVLNKAIRTAGNSLVFADLYPYLPEGTREAYPKFVAAAYICNFYKEHGIKPAPPAYLAETDSVHVNKWLSFQQIENTIQVPVEQLRKLNPIFKKDVVPYTVEGYLLKLPKSKGKQFHLLNDSAYKPLPNPDDFTPVTVMQSQPATTNTSNDTSATTKTPTQAKPSTENKTKPATAKFEKQRVTYTVKKGDVLGNIADWFDVTPKEIKSWNKMKSDRLIAGQKLTIWVNQSKVGYYKRIDTMSAAQKKKLKAKD
jgi:membrane-bound lytic murein transglycosylase D